MAENNLPDFLGIGAQKSGTSWIYNQLKYHPEICVSRVKELRFFLGGKSLCWYEQQFSHCQSGKLKGEITPEYMVLENSVEQIYNLLPNVKLFCILRNPTQRAFSQWKMAKRLGNVPKNLSFIEVFQENLQFLKERGHYAEQIQKLARFFPHGEKLLVLLYDELEVSPASLLCKLLKFLEVDFEWRSPKLDDIIGKSRDEMKIPAEAEKKLIEYYRPHVDNLSNLLNVDLSHWSNGVDQG